MVNQTDKDSAIQSFSFSEEGLGYAFVKKEIQSDENYSTDVFSVYGSDGTLLAAFDNRDTAMAAILQSGLKYMSLH